MSILTSKYNIAYLYKYNRYLVMYHSDVRKRARVLISRKLYDFFSSNIACRLVPRSECFYQLSIELTLPSIRLRYVRNGQLAVAYNFTSYVELLYADSRARNVGKIILHGMWNAYHFPISAYRRVAPIKLVIIYTGKWEHLGITSVCFD